MAAMSYAVMPMRNQTRARLAWGLALLMGSGCLEVRSLILPSGSLPLEFNLPGAVPVMPVAGSSPEYARRAVFTNIPGKVGSHAATVTALPDGALLAAWYSYEGPHELTGSAIYMSRRPAGQESWQQPWMHIDRPAGDGNPVLYSEGWRVWLFQAVVADLWSSARVEMQLSQDGGQSWSEPAGLPGPIGANVRFPPLRTPAGALVLPAYDDLFQRSLFYQSWDGSDWDLLGAVATSPAGIQPSVARLADGRLVCVMRNTAEGWLWVTASNDSGQSWSEPQDSGFPNSNSPAAILALSSGNLLLVYNDSPTDRVRLTAALSGDGGTTWPRTRLLAAAEEHCSYPSMVQAADGGIHILFSVGRERIDHVSCNEAWLAEEGGSP